MDVLIGKCFFKTVDRLYHEKLLERSIRSLYVPTDRVGFEVRNYLSASEEVLDYVSAKI
jgi:hypothetical protein